MKQIHPIPQSDTYGVYDKINERWIWTGKYLQLERILYRENYSCKDKRELTFNGIHLHNSFEVSPGDTYKFSIFKGEFDGKEIFETNFFPKRYIFFKQDIYGKTTIVNMIELIEAMFDKNDSLEKSFKYASKGFYFYIKNKKKAWEDKDTFRKYPVAYSGKRHRRRAYFRSTPNMNGIKQASIIYDGEKEYNVKGRVPNYCLGWWDDYERSNVRSKSWKNQKIKKQWMKKIR